VIGWVSDWPAVGFVWCWPGAAPLPSRSLGEKCSLGWQTGMVTYWPLLVALEIFLGSAKDTLVSTCNQDIKTVRCHLKSNSEDVDNNIIIKESSLQWILRRYTDPSQVWPVWVIWVVLKWSSGYDVLPGVRGRSVVSIVPIESTAVGDHRGEHGWNPSLWTIDQSPTPEIQRKKSRQTDRSVHRLCYQQDGLSPVQLNKSCLYPVWEHRATGDMSLFVSLL
jgi:hypothetical protein